MLNAVLDLERPPFCPQKMDKLALELRNCQSKLKVKIGKPIRKVMALIILVSVGISPGPFLRTPPGGGVVVLTNES